MTLLTPQRLLYLHGKGLICGPKESTACFLERVSATKEFKQHSALTLELFGIDPTWIEIHYRNEGLLPWQGGCTTIEGSSCSIQLKKKSPSFYSSQEIIAHEAVHAARVTFDEPKFEEILAYRTSTSRFRRYFGPVVQNSFEPALFVATVSAYALSNVAAAFVMDASAFAVQWFFFVALIGQVGFALARLVKRQYIFKKCQKKLAKVLKEPKKALAVQLCLTDAEITAFAALEPQAITTYIDLQNKMSPRWEQIKLLFDGE